MYELAYEASMGNQEKQTQEDHNPYPVFLPSSYVFHQGANSIRKQMACNQFTIVTLSRARENPVYAHTGNSSSVGDVFFKRSVSSNTNALLLSVRRRECERDRSNGIGGDGNAIGRSLTRDVRGCVVMLGVTGEALLVDGDGKPSDMTRLARVEAVERSVPVPSSE